MAENSGKKACLIITTIILMILSIALFVIMLGLGAWGIVQAQVANPCSVRNLTGEAGCVPEFTILTAENVGSPSVDTVWAYWLGGATGVGIVWAIVQTFAGAALIATIAHHDQNKPAGSKVIAKSSSQQEMAEMADGPPSPEPSDIIEQQTITFGPVKKISLQPKAVRSLTPGAGFGLFFSLLFAAFAVLCLLWAIGISYDHTRRSDGTVATFVLVEFLAAIVMPICLFVSGILISAVLDFITRGMVDMRTFIPKFLPVVKFETGTTEDGKINDYWVIEDTFYFEVCKHNHVERNFLNSFDHCWATWFLNGIVCLGVHLAVAYFVDITLDTQTTLEGSDNCDTIDSTYQCFFAGNLSTVMCEMANTSSIHCFKFLRFGVDFDLIMAVSTSYAFYLVASTAFAYVFTVVKVILQIKPSKWWGLGFIIVGVLGIVGGIILAGFWFFGYASEEAAEIIHFNIINLAEYFMICSYIMIVGLLLVLAKWWENVDVPQHKPSVKRELVHYHDASRGEVVKAANEHAEGLAKKGEAEHKV